MKQDKMTISFQFPSLSTALLFRLTVFVVRERDVDRR